MSQHGDRGVETGRSSASQPFRVEDLFGFLRGAWGFARKVHDSQLDKEGESTGEALFVPDGDALNYSEADIKGEEDISAVFPREFRYGFPAASMAEVRLSDGGFFHVLDLTKGMVRVDCENGIETYNGVFRIVSENAWLSVWRVTGPDTSQIITTHYLRVRPS